MLNKKLYIKSNNFLVSRKATEDDYDKLNHSHCHDEYEILYITEGSGRCIIEGISYEIRPNTLFLIKPFEYHHVDIYCDAPYDRYVIHFKESCLIDECVEIISSICDNDEAVGSFNSQAITENVASTFDKFYFAEDYSEEDKLVFIKITMSELIFQIARIKGNKVEQDEEKLGARVVRYLNDHLTKELSLDNLAKRFFVSKYYLCRVFKKHNGISIHGYINQKRVMYAKQLIESGETASGAAYRVGFCDYSAFYRAYVKIVGKAPTAD